jgi:hypothetical protein
LAIYLSIDWGPTSWFLEFLVDADTRYAEIIDDLEEVLSKAYHAVGGPNIIDGQDTQIHEVPVSIPWNADSNSDISNHSRSKGD